MFSVAACGLAPAASHIDPVLHPHLLLATTEHDRWAAAAAAAPAGCPASMTQAAAATVTMTRMSLLNALSSLDVLRRSCGRGEMAWRIPDDFGRRSLRPDGAAVLS